MHARLRARWWLAGVLGALLLCAFDWPLRTARLLTELEHTDDLAERCDLVRLLGQRPGSQAETALIALLDEPRVELRREVVLALAGRRTEPAQNALAVALTDQAALVRAAAAQGLARSGSVAHVPALIRALGDADAEARAAAASALGLLADKTASAPLAVALDDESPEVRMAAARALAELRTVETGESTHGSRTPNRDAWSALLAKLHDPAPEMRLMVIRLLAKLDPQHVEPLLVQALDDPSDSVQLEAMRGLAALPGPTQGETQARLKALARDGRPRLASAASALLKPRGQSEASWVDLLAQTDRVDPMSSESLLNTLEQVLPPGEELAADPLLLWLQRAPLPLRGRIAMLIARAAPQASIKLVPLLSDADPHVRRAAAHALTACRDRAALPSLSKALQDPDEQVGSAAARALGSLCTTSTLSDLQRDERWTKASPAMTKRLSIAVVGCLAALADQVPPLTGDVHSKLERRLLPLFDAASSVDPDLASVLARALAFFPSSQVSLAFSRAYRGAEIPLRVAILRASVRDRSSEAQTLRQGASRDESPPAIVATARVAAWLARDPGVEKDAALDVFLSGQGRSGQDLTWPLGPVGAFLLASSPQTAVAAANAQRTEALQTALRAREPITRANAKAGMTTPAARAPHTVQGQPEYFVPGSFRALVMPDGRILVSVADGSGDVSWPDLPQVVTENPWRSTYRPE